MGFDAKDFARRLAARNERVSQQQVTQPNPAEGLPSVAPQTGQTLPGVQTIQAIGWQLIGVKKLAAGADVFQIGPVPSSTKALSIICPVPTGLGPVISVLKGDQSKTNYWLPASGVNITGLTMIPVNGLLDTTYTFTITTGNSQTVYVFASDALVAEVNQGQLPTTRSQSVVIASGQSAIPVLASWSTLATYIVAFSGISSGALGAGGSKVLASLWHTGASAKILQLRRLVLWPDAITAATIALIELFYFNSTTLPSGGTAITPALADPSDAASEGAFMTLPTTVGATENGVPLARIKPLYGIIAGSVSDLARAPLELYRHQAYSQAKPPSLRAATQEGFNLKVTTSNAATLTFSGWGEFTEAAP